MSSSIKASRNLVLQPHRNAWVEINLSALEHNARWWRRQIPAHIEAMAVVKADAYGHGAVRMAPILKECGFTWLGVSNIDEALQLREAGVEMPILVLGASPEWGWKLAHQHNISITIFSAQELQHLAQLNVPLNIHIKVDTGMHRIGCAPEDALHFIQACQQLPHVCVEGIFTHFACGESLLETAEQWQRFRSMVLNVLPERPKYIHASNTPSLLVSTPQLGGYSEACNLARVGIGLYGYETHYIEESQALQPLMGLKARISRVQYITRGEGVSYGHAWRCDAEQACVVTVPLGYADGVLRPLSQHIGGMWQNQRIQQVGNITMDQMMFHIPPSVLERSVRLPEPGDIITLLLHGEAGQQERDSVPIDAQGLSLRHWAAHTKSIPYEMMCALRVRLPRSVVR
jgi:alanine racemase